MVVKDEHKEIIEPHRIHLIILKQQLNFIGFYMFYVLLI